MRITELVRIDSKGRILMPSSVRSLIGMREGMYVMLIADSESRQVSLLPFADPDAKLAEFRIEISDVPGSLAKIARVLADANVDLLASESRTLRRKELAEWHVIADISKRSHEVDEIRERILKVGKAKDVKIRELSALR